MIKELRCYTLAQLTKVRSSEKFRNIAKTHEHIDDPREEFKPPKVPKITIFEKVRQQSDSLLASNLNRYAEILLLDVETAVKEGKANSLWLNSTVLPNLVF